MHFPPGRSGHDSGLGREGFVKMGRLASIALHIKPVFQSNWTPIESSAELVKSEVTSEWLALRNL
jgi:hypothetical protein